MDYLELADHLKAVLRELQIRLEQARSHYEELLHKRNAIHSAISTLADRESKRD